MKNLYKAILSIIAWAMIISTAQAQMFSQRAERKLGTVEYGIIGGLHFADFSGGIARFNDVTGLNITKTQSRLTGNVGLFASVFVHRDLAIQPEVVWSFRGAKQKIDGGNFLYRMSYIHIPVLLKAVATNASNITPYFIAGPSISFLVDDKYKFDTSNSQVSGKLNEYNLNTRNTLFDLNFGAGVQVGPLMVEGRYLFGLNDSFKNLKTQHNVFAINFGIGLHSLF